MPLFAANDPFSSLIGLVIFVVIAAASHFLKRKRAGQGGEESPTEADERPWPVRRGDEPAPAPAGRTLSWEEELKRLLEGQTPVEPPTAPPVVVTRREATAPPPLPVKSEPAPDYVRQELPLPPVFSRTGQTEETESHELHDIATGHMAAMDEASAAHERASHIGDFYRDRVESAGLLEHTAPATRSAVRPVKRSAEIESVVTLLRRPITARQVFIATAVFGPPGALAE